MRRSKSDPSKYASNYRRISQRHMTGYGGDDNDVAPPLPSTGAGGGEGIGYDRGPRGRRSGDDEDAREKNKLESIIRTSESTWKRGLDQQQQQQQQRQQQKDGGKVVGGKDCDGPEEEENDGEKKRNKNGKEGRRCMATTNNEGDDDDGGDDMLSLLSPELRAQFAGMGNDALVVLPGKRRKKSNNAAKAPPPLTPAEIKAAKAAYKNAMRKLAQLETRRQRKELRSGLYRELEEHTLIRPHAQSGAAADNDDDGGEKKDPSKESDANHPTTIDIRQAQSLLLKSSELGKKLTKKERLKQLRRKEALGITLTREEMDALYVRYDAPPPESFPENDSMGVDDDDNDGDSGRGPSAKTKRHTKTKKKRKVDRDDDEQGETGGGGNNDDDMVSSDEGNVHAQLEQEVGQVARKKSRSPVEESDASSAPNESIPTVKKDIASANVDDDDGGDAVTEPVVNPLSFSQMMFASLSTLKATTDTRNAELDIEMASKRTEEEERIARLEEEERKRQKVYVPSSETITISTMHRPCDDDANEKSSSDNTRNKKRNVVVQRIDRPASIEESRYDLPVSGMEYEIIDAVRSNDCTILCGETGSGKSTQVPQFLYEAGFATSSWWRVQQRQQRRGGSANGSNDDGRCGNDDDDDDDDDCGESTVSSTPLLIGITQPRRVAAVSTAKRVCFEMGRGNGHSISNDNLVAYQTRYETSGLGKSTRVKFMTDGILLQEIQSDLLLRKYGAIVIDEAHERNLNTDVLLGLLSLALPMRRKAAEEGSLPPLKLVIMSATLRVEDFVNNDRLFPEKEEANEVGGDGATERRGSKPALVTVPGRTHPVSIHHSKVTELDGYGKCINYHVCFYVLGWIISLSHPFCPTHIFLDG